MADEYRCPHCKSSRVRIRYPEIVCLDCRYSDTLIDYPVSWDYHRALCVENGRSDPGPCYPARDSIEVRLEKLENRIETISEEEIEKVGFKYLKDEISQLRMAIRYTQQLIPKTKSRKQPAKSPAMNYQGLTIYESAEY